MADLAYWEVYHMNQIEARKHAKMPQAIASVSQFRLTL